MVWAVYCKEELTCSPGESVRGGASLLEGEFKTFRGSSAKRPTKRHAAIGATIGANVGATIGGTIGGAFVYIPLPLH